MDHKEAHRLFWLVKGHLGDEATVLSSANGYFKRLWGNCERSVYAEEGFEEAYYLKYPDGKED
jgi:hypothetical protein|tara:strand:- start:125 stop:313 length:189 start_codon:yes stop_codon:yes gene_type:complete